MIPTTEILARATRLASAALVVGMALVFLFILLFAGGSGRLEVRGVRIAYDLVAFIVLVPWLLLAAVRPTWLPASHVWPAIVACLAAFVISTATSRAGRLSVEMLAYAILIAELYLLLVAILRRPKLRAHVERLAIAMGIAICILYLVQVGTAWVDWWGLVGRVTVPPLRPGYLGLSFGSPNPVATVVLVLGAFAVATLRGPGRWRLGATIVIVILVAACTVVSGSRGAWLGAAAGLIAAAVVALLGIPGVRSRAALALRSRRAIAATAITAVGVVVAGSVAARSGRLTLDDGGYREAFAAASGRMFASAPVTGTGPGTWQILRAANQDSVSADLYIPHAHNIYWQTLAEFGLVGVLAGTIALASLARLLLRSLRSGDEKCQRVALAAVFGVVLLAVQQGADMLMNVPGVLLAMAIPLAWLDASMLGVPSEAHPHRGRAAWPGRLARTGSVIAAVATSVIVAWLIQMESTTAIAQRAVAAGDAGRWDEAQALAARATTDDPGVNVYWFVDGLAAADAGDLARAARSLALSAQADDYPFAWLDLAAVRWRSGDAAGARTALTRAERLGTRRAELAVPAGWLRLEMGDEDGATRDLATAIADAPTLVTDPFWDSTPELRQLRPAILRRARADADASTRLAIELLVGDLDAARSTAARLADADPDLYHLVPPAWEGDDVAWRALTDLAAARPVDGGPAYWARIIALHRGDAGAVDDYGKRLAILTGSDAGLPLVARIRTRGPGELPPAMLDRYGSLYRRAVPAAPVTTLLPQVTWQPAF